MGKTLSSLLVPPSVPEIRVLPHLSAGNRRLSSMGCSRLGQSRSLLSGGVHQRRGANPADLVGSTGRSGSNPPGGGRQTVLHGHTTPQKFTINTWVAWSSKCGIVSHTF